ncbi:uncharacterized protein DUF4237 [Halopolyspora algeriensis]|uniref:Uncharacterized protein DUF4237 n=1 Tax=Halopolyspora algeriensis TaxID=1500506 RepID=A0A368VCF3_9ACTN|nr:glycohydrolase toxin TNT-related protein [Halopolyspora algeriensis]RCW38806.1 uncharacterized protein DUF4237 [Halopolyspora algeriensis]TQM46682.1 uncharacterized protein DUF4237 [Halopolyspora algeriensis]
MSRPTAISPEEQEQIARRIGVLLLQEAPEDWQQITVEYRATGEYRDLLGETARQDGSTETWQPPEELLGIFEHLREGMYRPDVGTWISALYIVERPSSYRIDINFDEEPQWQQPLPGAAYVDELRRYPRSEENIPDWMRARLEGSSSNGAPQPPQLQPPEPQPPEPQPPEPQQAPPQAPVGNDVTRPQEAAIAADRQESHDSSTPGGQQHFRTARVFDDVDEQGRPLVATRTPVSPEESSSLRQYLENAPIVLAARDDEVDQLAPERPAVVPATWHTDGVWLWQGALPYYLAQYGLPPEPELLEHIRSRRFVLPEIDDRTRDAAASALVDQPAPEESPAAGGAPEAPRESDAARADEYLNTSEHSAVDASADSHPERHAPVEENGALPDDSPGHNTPMAADALGGGDIDAEGPGIGARSSDDAAADGFGADEQQAWHRESEPQADAVSAARHGHTEEENLDVSGPEAVFAQLDDRLSGLGVDTGSYRIGSRAEDTWCLVAEGADWLVIGPRNSPGELRFARADQAAAYLLGGLLMSQADPEAGTARGGAPEPAESSASIDPFESDDSAESDASSGADALPGSADSSPEAAIPDDPPPSSTDAQHRSAEDSDEHFLFTANRSPQPEGGALSAPESPAAQDNGADGTVHHDIAASEERTHIRPALNQERPAPPVGQAPPPPPNESTSGGTAASGQEVPPLPKRPPRADGAGATPPQSDAGNQPPAPVNPPPTGGPAGADQRQSGSGGPGMASPSRPAAPGEPPRPPQAGNPGEPPTRLNSTLNRPPQSGPGEPPRPPQAPVGQAPPGQALNGHAPGGGPPAGQAGGPPAPQQPIEPLQGEPPLTLYRDRHTVVLQPGTDLDRFGEPSGNVTYAIRTPYTQRSLPPQWANRTYLAYRVQRPVHALRGTAVPWFEQQGGGTAYVLPAAVSELVANGTLIALTGNEAPPRPSME